MLTAFKLCGCYHTCAPGSVFLFDFDFGPFFMLCFCMKYLTDSIDEDDRQRPAQIVTETSVETTRKLHVRGGGAF